MILRQPSQILRTNSSCCFRTLPSTVTNAHISRSIHRTAWLNYPSKDSQDKDSLNPRSTEYSKSQSDDNSARIEKTAFDPNETSPEGQMAMANKESGQDISPLDASPANKDISKPKSEQEGGPEKSASGTARSGQSSGKGSPAKAGGEKSG